MPTINNDFPLSADARKEHLKEIIRDSHPISSVKVPGHGPLPVYRIPLQFLSYNPYNTRFLSQAKTWQKRLGRRLSNERPEDVAKIEDFLWSYKKDKNENTIHSLINEGQLQPGVVTVDGLILAGNRRFRLLNEIDRNPKKYNPNNVNISGLKFFEAAIIDTVLTEKEIVRYESFYQYGAEDKVDYDPIQKYIAAKEQRDYDFSPEEIAKNFAALTNGDKKIVDKWLDVYDLMAEYLDYIGEPEIYTALAETEESFLNLLATITSLARGRTQNANWDYDTMDIADLKLRYFDYIRMGKSTHDFRDFKKIFLNKSRWKNFNAEVQELIDKVSEEIPTIDEYRKNYPEETEDWILKVRSTDYRNKTEKKLDKLFGEEKSYILSKEEEETPLKTAQKAYQKLEKLLTLIDAGLDSSVNFEELLNKVKDIQKIIGKIKQIID
ncbi:hypothetical protein IJG44_03220 [bacterium]|nr:hypothetical protein [bacterium]